MAMYCLGFEPWYDLIFSIIIVASYTHHTATIIMCVLDHNNHYYAAYLVCIPLQNTDIDILQNYVCNFDKSLLI